MPPKTKLTPAQIVQITAFPADITHAEIARDFAVDASTVSRIRAGKYGGAAAPAPAPAAAPAGDIVLLCLAQLVNSPLNPRRHFDDEALEELTDSIAVNGLLQNLVVRRAADGRTVMLSPDFDGIREVFEIVAGERRWRALNRLALRGLWNPNEPNIPCKVVAADDEQHLALALLENLKRQDVSPLEEAEAFARLQRMDKAKWATAEIARQIGCTPRYVQQRLTLVNKLAPAAQKALGEGRITFTHARVIAGAPRERQPQLLKLALANPEQSADSLRGPAISGMVPAERAIFPVAESGLELHTDDNGRQWIRDRKAFLARQREAALCQVALLKARHGWAELVDYFYGGNYVAGAGAVVHLDYEGTVVTCENLAPKPRAADPDQEAKWQRQRLEREAKEQAAAQLRQALAAAIAGDPPIAARLLLLHAACTSYCTGGTSPLSQFGGLPKRLVNGGALAPLAGLVDQADGNGHHRLKAGDGSAAWAALLTVAERKLGPALAGLAADQLEVNPYRELHPVVTALARHYRIAIPPALAGDQADLEDTVNAAGADDTVAETAQEAAQ